jgi:hypothetical protein
LSEATVTGYVVIIERDEAGRYSVWAPDLPGVIAAVGFLRRVRPAHARGHRVHFEGLRQD